MSMGESNSRGWHFHKQINLSVLVQLVFLASLIIGSWVNLQRQLDLLAKDVAVLIESQKDIKCKIEQLTEKSISYDYRLRAVEKQFLKSDTAEGSY